METSLVFGGLALAAIGISGRRVTQLVRAQLLPRFAWTKRVLDMKGYYKGGFEPTMNKAEAARILGVGMNAPKLKIRTAHKRLMMSNHPDRGGSQYVATKINEAKVVLEK